MLFNKNQSFNFELNCIDINELYLNTTNDFTTYNSVRYTFAILYSLVICTGFCGNLCVILSVLRKPSLRTVRNIFLVNLSCSDIVVCLTSVILTPVTAISKNWHFGAGLCYVVPLFQCTSICISTFTLTCIAIDRYILICHPTKKPIDAKTAIFLIFAVWTISLAVSSPLVAHMKMMTIKDICGVFCGELWPSEAARIAYGAVIFVLQFVIPFAVMGYSYNRIYIQLSQGILVRKASASSASRYKLTESERRVLRHKFKTNRMLIMMVVLFGACWSLSVCQNLLRDAKALPDFIKKQEAFYHLVVHWLSVTSTVWNPLLYAAFNSQFREAFKELLPCYKDSDASLGKDINKRLSQSTLRYTEKDWLLSDKRSTGGTPVSLLRRSMSETDSPKRVTKFSTVTLNGENSLTHVRKSSDPIRIRETIVTVQSERAWGLCNEKDAQHAL